MNIFVLVNSGLEQTAQTEIKELLGLKAQQFGQLLSVELKDPEKLHYYLQHSQAARRVLFGLGAFEDIENLKLEKIDFPWKDFFSTTLSLKIEVENVSGNDNRIKIARQVAGQLYPVLIKKIGGEPLLDLKHPDLLVIVYRVENKYYLGIDCSGKELNARSYRLCTSSFSFKGDLAYHLLRSSGFVSGNRLLVGWSKDGTVAIEAALYAHQQAVQPELPSWEKFPVHHLTEKEKDKEDKTIVSAFDSAVTNITAAQKNAALSGIKKFIQFSKLNLEDVDPHYSAKSFDQFILLVTGKDEDKLNEIYYQSDYVLKKNGFLLLVGRKNWEVSISSKFKLISAEEIVRGDSVLKLWLLKKK